MVEQLDGHGSDKTLSNLRPPDQHQLSTTPPPYRMPPYPIYNEPSAPSAATSAPCVPGASMPLATSSPTIPQGLQTHSNKFPIEREVIISSGDKNSKIPILHDYMKKARGAIAPDVPPKQTAAWTHAHTAYSNTNYPPTNLQYMNISETPLRRENAQTDFYNRDPQIQQRSLNPNPANQKIFWGAEQPSGTTHIPSPDTDYNNSKLHQSQLHQLENQRDDSKIKNKNLTKTYHAIKDIISNKFKSIKESESNSKYDEDLMNNTTASEDVKRNVQESYGISNMQIQHRYNQEVLQKHLLKSQLNHPQRQAYNHNQEIKYDCHPEEAFGSTPAIASQSPQSKHPDHESNKDDKNRYNDLGSFHGRRAMSQPHLINSKCVIPDNLPQPQTINLKRGSQMNMSDLRRNSNCDDEGGFLKVDLELQGASRKKLECEIGNIQGVYSVGSRTNEDGEGKKLSGSAASSDYEKVNNPPSNADSGRGSAAYSSGRRLVTPHGAADFDKFLSPDRLHTNIQQNDAEWVDIVEGELRNILKLKNQDETVTNSTISESISSMTPPLPPLSPGEQSSPIMSRHNSTTHNQNRQQYDNNSNTDSVQTEVLNKWYPSSNQKHKGHRKVMQNSMIIKQRQNFGLDTTDITSTTTRSMDLESILDIHSESDGDLSSYGAQTIRKQLEGLEGMYTEVLKLLGVKKNVLRYQPSDPRFSKRRYGSVSSLQTSSVSSRPIRDKRRSHEDRKKVRDIKSINKRFQRLESHVVTLARSVAHLSSEMRTQHLMIQEMENIRTELSTLRTHTNMLNIRSQSATRSAPNLRQLPTLANPTRVKKLTNFFGDEPPLLRLFLRNMGYEKYATSFEKESIGMIELPYMSEERLQKMGIPLGPRLRIMEEAQISVFKDNTLCIV